MAETPIWPTKLFFKPLLTNHRPISQGLVTNGSRVIITALPTDPIDDVVHELNVLGSPSGGTAEG